MRMVEMMVTSRTMCWPANTTFKRQSKVMQRLKEILACYTRMVLLEAKARTTKRLYFGTKSRPSKVTEGLKTILVACTEMAVLVNKERILPKRNIGSKRQRLRGTPTLKTISVFFISTASRMAKMSTTKPFVNIMNRWQKNATPVPRTILVFSTSAASLVRRAGLRHGTSILREGCHSKQRECSKQLGLSVPGWVLDDNQPDFEKARRWFERAAIQGNADAQNHLGFLYQNGYIGHPEDEEANYKVAQYWYKKAAAQNFANAQDNLGNLFTNGYNAGKGRNYHRSLLVRKGGESRSRDCAKNLDFLYETGFNRNKSEVSNEEDEDKNYQMACHLYERAAAAGFDSAVEALERIKAVERAAKVNDS